VQDDENNTEGSYYAMNKEARKEYQRRYYAENRHKMRRQRELREVLEPDKAEAYRAYQRAYYLEHRTELTAKRRERDRRKKQALFTSLKNPTASVDTCCNT
jgi:hypothetical protein